MTLAQAFITAGLLFGVATGLVGTMLPAARFAFRWVGGLFAVTLVAYLGVTLLAPPGAPASTAHGTAPAASPAGPVPSAAPVVPSASASPARPSPSTVDTEPAAPPVPDPLFLDTVRPAGGSGDRADFGAASTGDQDFRHAVGLCGNGIFSLDGCARPETDTWLEYGVDPAYRSVTAVVGLSAESAPACRVHGQVLLDGTELFAHDLSEGDVFPLTATVAGGHRLRLQMRVLTGAGRCDLIYGNAALHP